MNHSNVVHYLSISYRKTSHPYYALDFWMHWTAHTNHIYTLDLKEEKKGILNFWMVFSFVALSISHFRTWFIRSFYGTLQLNCFVCFWFSDFVAFFFLSHSAVWCSWMWIFIVCVLHLKNHFVKWHFIGFTEKYFFTKMFQSFFFFLSML